MGDGRHPRDERACHGAAEESSTRRRFLGAMAVGIGALVAAAGSIPFVGIVLSPLGRRRIATWIDVGRVDQFSVGETVKVTYVEPGSVAWSGPTSRSAAWLRRTSDDEFVVLSGSCTHVGCPVDWRKSAGLFLCPCHGGAYHQDGSVAAGPPPRPLPLYPVRVRSGRVEVMPQPIAATSTI